MPSSTSAPTSSTSRRSCSSRPATARRCSPTTRFSMPTRSTGSRARSGTLWKRVLKRVDLTSRSLVALVEPGSCFAGTLAELAFATDRSYMLIGKLDGDNRPPATLALAAVEFRRLSDVRTGSRGWPAAFSPILPTSTRPRPRSGKMLDAETAQAARPRHLRARRHRLGRRDPRVPGGARELFARRADRAGGQSALRRPGDHGIENLRPPHRLAELDLPAPQCGRRGGRAQALRHRPEAGVRYACASECALRLSAGHGRQELPELSGALSQMEQP